MPEIACVNGKFTPIGEAVVSVEDRGYQFGDAVYEAIAVYGGRPFLLDRHLARLQRSLHGIAMEAEVSNANIESLVHEGLRRSEISDAIVYLQVSRGVAPRSHVIPNGIRPTIVLTFRSLPKLSEELRQRGARAITVVDTRWSNCYIKAVTLLPNVLAKNDVLRRGYDEAIFVTEQCEVREFTSANIFVVRKGVLEYPPLTESVLHGVTLGFILECAAALEIPVRASTISADELYAADEVFLSSTTAEVLGVTSVDDKSIGDGQVGALTQRLFRAFRERSRGQ